MLDQTPQSNAPAGVYTISATFQNKIGSPTVKNIFFEVATLTNSNVLINADGGPAGAGAILTIPATDLGPDGLLSPGESFTTDFAIGLQTLSPFDFFVDAFGEIDGVSSSGIVSLLSASFDNVSTGGEETSSQMKSVYLPLISN